MQDKFDNLREQLAQDEWPGVYLFKFIVLNTSEGTARVAALFNESADLQFQPSKTGKYVSVSGKELMMDVESIIDRYKKAGEVPGVISL
jgi:hypothetical protein